MSSTYTRSETSTYSEARAKYVLQKAWDDFVALMSLNIISKDFASNTYFEFKYLLDIQALKRYQIKIINNGVALKAWQYEVFDNGSVHEDSESGGVELYNIPSTAKASIVVEWVSDPARREKAQEYVKSRGWGNDGSFLNVQSTDRAFSKDGYGLTRSICQVTT